MLTLADAILQENLNAVQTILRYGIDLNELDEYGFTPLIEAAIVDDAEIASLLLDNSADPNFPDSTGGTALHWASENNNLVLARLLLENGADANAYNFSGQPVLVMPTLRRQSEIRQLLIKSGADEIFAQDFINVKLLGHMFELIGTATIIDPKNEFVEVDFEGFFLEITLGLVTNSLAQFQNHFAARQLRRYSGITQMIVNVMERAAALIKFQQYLVDIKRHEAKINELLAEEPLLIPIGYEGHAITFVKFGQIWAKCDRREDSRLYDNIMFYKMNNQHKLTKDFIKNLVFEKQSSEFINRDLDQLLALQPITELKITSQISGNCSWANVEAVIPTLFFLALMQNTAEKANVAYAKTLAINFFERWREWNKDRALHYCIQSYKKGDAIRKASKAEILAAVLFQRCDPFNAKDTERIEAILAVFKDSPYQYILKNYLRVFYYESNTEEGKRFATLLDQYGVKV